MAIPKTKTNRRAVDMGEAVQNLEKELRELAIETYKFNIMQNAAKKIYDKKRGLLLAQMKNMKLKSKIFNDVEISETIDGKVVTKKLNLEALVDRPEQEKADIFALHKLVDDELFLQIVSATKKSVVDLAGTAVFEQIKVTSEGEENVSVKPLK